MYDIAIIGGGIHGCGCAADAAMRGLKVVLIEQDDLGSKTSSSSSKLIHGGLRYLENLDFKMVRKSLIEQKTLLRNAKYMVKPLPFVLPATPNRPKWLLKAGLFIYDNLIFKDKSISRSKYIQQKQNPDYFTKLSHNISDGFIYYDCKTDDSRLTIINALQAHNNGATILTNTKLSGAKVKNGVWSLELRLKSEKTRKVQAKIIINATGPWIDKVSNILNIKLNHQYKLVKGSHIVVDKLYAGEHAYILQHIDGRIVFVIPYHNHSLIGTTEQDFSRASQKLAISKTESNYLLGLINSYFDTKLTINDIRESWSGLRTLNLDSKKSSTKLSRDYLLQLTKSPAPCITICGGKLTTYRKLASDAIDKLRIYFPKLPKSSTKNTLLPGSQHAGMHFSEYATFAYSNYQWLPPNVLQHYLNTYGTLTEAILKSCNCEEDLGIKFSNLLYQAEVDYLINNEWAHRVDDIIWRRTKHGLHLDDSAQTNLQEYLTDKYAK